VTGAQLAAGQATGFDDRPGVVGSTAAVGQDGKVLTSRGTGTAMEFALALVETLTGAARRQQVEAALLRAEPGCTAGGVRSSTPVPC